MIFRATSVSKMRQNQLWIARFVSFRIRIFQEHGSLDEWGREHVGATPANRVCFCAFGARPKRAW